MLAVVGSTQGRTVPDVRDPLGFFTTVADKMLRGTFPFGVTNIPVCSHRGLRLGIRFAPVAQMEIDNKRKNKPMNAVLLTEGQSACNS